MNNFEDFGRNFIYIFIFFILLLWFFKNKFQLSFNVISINFSIYLQKVWTISCVKWMAFSYITRLENSFMSIHIEHVINSSDFLKNTFSYLLCLNQDSENSYVSHICLWGSLSIQDQPSLTVSKPLIGFRNKFSLTSRAFLFLTSFPWLMLVIIIVIFMPSRLLSNYKDFFHFLIFILEEIPSVKDLFLFYFLLTYLEESDSQYHLERKKNVSFIKKVMFVFKFRRCNQRVLNLKYLF